MLKNCVERRRVFLLLLWYAYNDRPFCSGQLMCEKSVLKDLANSLWPQSSAHDLYKTSWNFKDVLGGLLRYLKVQDIWGVLWCAHMPLRRFFSALRLPISLWSEADVKARTTFGIARTRTDPTFWSFFVRTYLPTPTDLFGLSKDKFLNYSHFSYKLLTPAVNIHIITLILRLFIYKYCGNIKWIP